MEQNGFKPWQPKVLFALFALRPLAALLTC